MKLHYTLALALLLSVTFINAQDITWGDNNKTNTLANTYSPIGYEGGKTYVYHSKFSGVTTFDGEMKGIIEVYDTNLELESSVELEKKRKGQKGKDVSEVEATEWTDQNILLIRSKYDKSSDTKSLFSQVYNRKTNKLSESEDLFGELASSKKRKTSVNTITSADKSKVLVFTFLEDIKGEPSEYGFYVLDSSGELLWKRQTAFGKSSDTKAQDYEISNSGVVYVALSELDSSGEVEAVSVYSLNEDERKDNNHKLEPNYELRFTRFNLEISPRQTVMMASFHRDGCYFEELDESLSKAVSKKEFNINQLSETVNFKTDRVVKSKKIGNDLETMDIIDYTFHENGSTTITGEFFSIKSTRSSSGVVTSTYYRYDLMLVNFSASGKITWSKRIPKRQFMAADSRKYGGVLIAEIDDNIELYYNDHVDNFETGMANRLAKVKDAETLQIKITADGEITKETLFNGEESKLLLNRAASSQVSDELLLLSRSAPVKGMTGLDKMSFGLMKF